MRRGPLTGRSKDARSTPPLGRRGDSVVSGFVEEIIKEPANAVAAGAKRPIRGEVEVARSRKTIKPIPLADY